MNVKKKPMSFGQKFFYAISFIVLIAAFIFLGTRNYKIKELSDQELFYREYRTVSVNNHFEVLDSYEALTFLENGTGLLFFGFSQNKWSASVAEILDEVSKKLDYSPIYYFNFYDERESKHDNYLGILREIDEYLDVDDKGNLNLYAPTIVGVVKGEVVYFDNETSFMKYNVEPKDYWNEDQRKKKKERLESIMTELQRVMKGE